MLGELDVEAAGRVDMADSDHKVFELGREF